MVTADGADSNTCDDIAEQLIQNETGKKLKVILGGGRSYFTPTGFLDPETGANIGRRRDGKNLINQWITDHPTGAYVNTRDELVRLNLTKTDAIFGKFCIRFNQLKLRIHLICFKQVCLVVPVIWSTLSNRKMPTIPL